MPITGQDPRFFSKVHITSQCWEWVGARSTAGYGYIWWAGKQRPAHRVSYEQMVGPIPEGLHIDHLCRNPSCVRPEHLEPVTNRENSLRGIARFVNGANQRNKTHCPSGHPYTGRNLILKKRPGKTPVRKCRACENDYQRRRYRRKKERNGNAA